MHAQDGPALKLAQLDNVLELMRDDENDLARYLLPWSLIELAVRNEGLSFETRLSCLEIAFESLRAIYDDIDLSKGEPVWTGMQMIRGMNLCVSLWRALHTPCPEGIRIALGRIGSHSLECHFGIVRSMLHGERRFDLWMCAEVRAELVSRYLDDLRIDPITRRSRVPTSGVRIDPNADEGAAAIGLDLADSFEEYMKGDDGASEGLLAALDNLALECDAPEIPQQSPSCGLSIPAR
jgi:hypothetical protein